MKFFSTMMSATMTFNFSGQGGKKKTQKSEKPDFASFYNLKDVSYNAGKYTGFIFIELLITCLRKKKSHFKVK